IVVAFLAMLAFGAITYYTVEVAGGTGISPEYSNTPNGVVPGPPGLAPTSAGQGH
ncbi:MAG: hypothetical protein JWN55_2764, partial [Frankiales bacterium]|nr:hypothetical protein [Frankiales bacterium]